MGQGNPSSHPHKHTPPHPRSTTATSNSNSNSNYSPTTSPAAATPTETASHHGPRRPLPRTAANRTARTARTGHAVRTIATMATTHPRLVVSGTATVKEDRPSAARCTPFGTLSSEPSGRPRGREVKKPHSPKAEGRDAEEERRPAMTTSDDHDHGADQMGNPWKSPQKTRQLFPCKRLFG